MVNEPYAQATYSSAREAVAMKKLNLDGGNQWSLTLLGFRKRQHMWIDVETKKCSCVCTENHSNNEKELLK